ncbi:DUF1214 domain-containing protein [Flavicella marina]|uniref:DUF1214 domain-containing protein n=1 Tax=Flavicella marina TaxID=1475951 RepID=UPI0012658CE6|nr:DUF1214 domain-containing protein [Flavicella marina]
MKNSKLVWIALLIVGIVSSCKEAQKTETNETTTAAIIESKIIDSAIAYQKAGGKAEFMDGEVLQITDENYAHAETAKNYRNWMAKGANEGLVHLRIMAPRGAKAPTVQMNHDCLYSVAITKVVNGKISFEIPEDVLVYTSVQVVDQYGHGQHYIVTKGKHTLNLDTADGTTHAFLIFRSGLEKGIEVAKENQNKLTTWGLVSGDFKVPNYDFAAVDAKTDALRSEVVGKAFYYTFPRNEKDVTDRHQWNLECALGWGGASPIVNESNLYSNSKMYDGKKSYSTTFMNPESVYFTSITVYDAQRYLFEDEDVKNINSNTWEVNSDNTVTISFNCGEGAKNNIDTKGQDFTFTLRYYGVTDQVLRANNKDAVPNRLNPVFMMKEVTRQ